MSIADYIIAPAPLTGNPVGVNSVRAHQKARDHHALAAASSIDPSSRFRINAMSSPTFNRARAFLIERGHFAQMPPEECNLAAVVRLCGIYCGQRPLSGLAE